jgi:hypothetical protein
MIAKSMLKLKIMFILCVAFSLMSCATIIGKNSELLNIRSTPEQAQIIVADEAGIKIFEGKTPTILTLQKKKGYFSGKKFNITISKEGFRDHVITVDTKLSGWYLGGNLIFGGLIGWFIVDPATGAMWTLDTNEVDVSLETALQTGIQQNSTAVVLLQDVPESLRQKMVPISQ